MAKMIVTRITRAIQILPKLVSLRTDQTAAPSNLPAILIVTHENQTPALSNAANVVNHALTRRTYGAPGNLAQLQTGNPATPTHSTPPVNALLPDPISPTT